MKVSNKIKIVVVGWGRMGMTHTSILGGLFPDKINFEIVEPNFYVRSILKNTLKYKCHNSINDVDLENSKVLITTPPSTHKFLTEYSLTNGASNIFVEKPFGLFDNKIINDDRISVGYVLRFTEVAQTLKNIIKEEGCESISINYNSNTIEKKPSGWRNGKYGGVISEMGSHLIDLLMYILNSDTFKIIDKKIFSVVSDVDDKLILKGLCNKSNIELTLNWVDKNQRKPVWFGNLVTEKRIIKFDQQSISCGFKHSQVNYYVRGRDFSSQMDHFFHNKKNIICNASQANNVHEIIKVIKN